MSLIYQACAVMVFLSLPIPFRGAHMLVACWSCGCPSCAVSCLKGRMPHPDFRPAALLKMVTCFLHVLLSVLKKYLILCTLVFIGCNRKIWASPLNLKGYLNLSWLFFEMAKIQHPIFTEHPDQKICWHNQNVPSVVSELL